MAVHQSEGRIGFGGGSLVNSMKKMPGVGWRSTCAGVMAGRVPRRVPLNSISVVSGGLSELCYQQLTDSKKASKVRIPPSPHQTTDYKKLIVITAMKLGPRGLLRCGARQFHYAVQVDLALVDYTGAIALEFAK